VSCELFLSSQILFVSEFVRMSFPIRELTPYHKTWTIKGRVVAKSTTRTFNKIQQQGGSLSGEGKVFSVDVIDADGGEIRCSFFNEAVDKFAFLEEGKCYSMSKGSVRVANKAYNQANHDYEILFNVPAVIAEIPDDGSIKAQKLSFNCVNDIRTVKTKGLPCLIDMIGIASEVQETRNWSKDGKQYSKYQFTLCDESEHSIDVSLFGETAVKHPREKLLPEGGASLDGASRDGAVVVAVKGVVVKAFQGGRSGVLNDSGAMLINPQEPELVDRTNKLKKWWQSTGKNKAMSSMAGSVGTVGGKGIDLVSFAKLVDEVEPNILESNQEGEIVECIGRIQSVITTRKGENIPVWYAACQLPRAENLNQGKGNAICNKKCDPQGYCPIHREAAINNSKLRWMLRMTVCDHSGHSYLGLFDEDVTKILGKTAEEASKLSDSQLENFLDQRRAERLFKFRLKPGIDEYQGQKRIRERVLAVDPVNPIDRAREMLKDIRRFTGTQQAQVAGA